MGATRTPLLALAVLLLLAAAMTVGGHEHALSRLADDPTLDRPHKSVATGTGAGASAAGAVEDDNKAYIVGRPLFKGGGSSLDDDQSEPGSGRKLGDGGGRSRQAPAIYTLTYYVHSYQVGTPPQKVTGVFDLCSELMWTECDPCASCGGGGVTPSYDSTLSTTMAEVRCASHTCQAFAAQNCSADGLSQCGYVIDMHRDGGAGEADTTGYLATESFTFGDTRVDDVVFGCGLEGMGEFAGVSGVIGLGRGPLSLVSQLFAGRFSYYFAPNDDGSSSGVDDIQSFYILFGDDATPQTKLAMTTPLLPNPNAYLVGLTGIKVDGKDIGVRRRMFGHRGKDGGSGGVVLSIADRLTFLPESAYRLLRRALVSRIRLPTANGSALGLDLCYECRSLARVKIPAMALVFDDGGAVMELEAGNYFLTDASRGLRCLTILPSPDGHASLLGSLIQAGTHMIFDVHSSTLAFESLQPPPSSSAPPQAPQPPSSSAPPPHTLPLLVLFAQFLWVAVSVCDSVN